MSVIVPDGWIEVKVVGRTPEAANIAGFELESVDGSELPPYEPGAHIEVRLTEGLSRSYSLCEELAREGRYRIAVLLDAKSRGGSAHLHANVHEGSVLSISSPRNHFPLDASDTQKLLIAGGIGITPLIAMADRLCRVGASFELHYSTRNPARTAFATRLKDAPYASRVRIYHSTQPFGPDIDVRETLQRSTRESDIYVCGPKGLIDHVLATARTLGWAENKLHHELFSAQVTVGDGDKPFDVVLANSGRVIRVRAGQTVVQALRHSGVEVPVSCEQGVCGTCLTGVLGGVPDHRDAFLLPDEKAANNQFLPCCSRARSDHLLLDL